MSNTAVYVGSPQAKCAKILLFSCWYSLLFWVVCWIGWLNSRSVTGNKQEILAILHFIHLIHHQGENGMACHESRPQPNLTLLVSAWACCTCLWPTQPRWLIFNDSWLRNGMPSHSNVWPGWWPAWGGGARLLWLSMDLPPAPEAPDGVLN